jgi:diguanylate cyclase (GGDEF)-like protein
MAPTQEQDLPLAVSRAILDTSDLDQILTAVLTGITSPPGLGFDRAFLFLADDNDRELRPYSAIGSSPKDKEHLKLSERLAGFAVPLSASAPAIDEGDENVPMQALLAHCVGLRKPFLSNTIQTFYQPPPASGVEVLRLTHVAAVPLAVKNSILGVLVADNTHSRREIGPEKMPGLETLGNLAAIAIEKSRLKRRLEEMSLRDGLTGVYNRRQYEARLEKEVEVAVRAQRALALVVFHVRRFKQVNQTHGRQCGDRVLKDLAAFLRQRVRTEDLIARYGEEEFVVMLTGGATQEEALKVAEKLRDQVIAQELGGLPVGEIQVCGGLAWLPPDRLEGERIARMLADALQQAQQADDNRMVSAPDA